MTGPSRHGAAEEEQASPTAEASNSNPSIGSGRTDPSRTEAAPPCAHLPLHQRLEVLLLSTDRPLSRGRLLELLGLADGGRHDLEGAIETLNRQYAETGRCFRIEALAGGWRALTLSIYAPLLGQLRGERDLQRLSQASLETLAIVAYRQPVLRAELEAIRGVACGEVLKTLIDRRLVRVTGRAEIVGRPMLYGTTREFLQVFGLSGLQDLPKVASGQAT